MPQTDLIEDMERNRRQMWEDKFIARMDGDQATKQRLTEELADQLTSMIEVQAERRQFLIDLRDGNLSSWTHTIADGDTTPSVPPDRHRTSTNQPTRSLGTGTSVRATSFPGSVPSSAPRSLHASAANRPASYDDDPDLAPIDERVLKLVLDPVFAKEEITGRIMTNFEHDLNKFCRRATSSVRESEALWQDYVRPQLQSLQDRVNTVVTGDCEKGQQTQRIMSEYQSWISLANPIATTNRCGFDDQWRKEMGNPASTFA
jgi:hypothetical protein